ncbi:malonyl CoA-ACP transacylase [Paenibacillus polymyxa]|uniref:ACP S-malonyltransferase n=1 Tax=Paenibacillus polymyxa TaxID=1406 RepID=UPI0005CE175A|nr:ACP S-malonyltransferase [Paenibacillus polymyxa]KJD38713.1 malonyl CoA-ACP transacylase [Paenibacillus polymyxa]
MRAFMFPGQGSQYVGMGQNLFDEFPKLTSIADQVLGYSIKQLCLQDPEQKLGNTAYTQPALYVVNALHFVKTVNDRKITPDFVAGHSLGEFNALFAAGAFDFEIGLELVRKRGELMSQVSPGAMAAVLGMDAKEIRAVLQDSNLQGIDIANLNTPTQIVISGLKHEINESIRLLGAAGARGVVPLNVSGAFHSRYMEEAQEQFKKYLSKIQFKELQFPVISNVHARPYNPSDIKRNLTDQMTHPVNWTDSMRYLLALGVESIEEIGPKQVLTKLLDQIRNEAEPLDLEAEQIQSKPLEGGKMIISSGSLGNEEFRKKYGLKYAYYAGGMHKGISSKEMVIALAKGGLMGFLGVTGLAFSEIEDSLHWIRQELDGEYTYGVNLAHDPFDPQREEALIEMLIKNKVKVLEASSFVSITPALVLYRAAGLRRGMGGRIVSDHKIIAKVSRPEVAEFFLSPAPESWIQKLLRSHKISEMAAELLKNVPMADDLCVEADSAMSAEQGPSEVIMPVICRLRDQFMKKYGYKRRICVGLAGGIGVPEAAAASFIMGADFIMTGSINQCTVEAGTSNQVKDLLQQMKVQDTAVAPIGRLFHIGAKAQFLRKGVFFPARANKLYELFKCYDSLEEIDDRHRSTLQDRYFKRSFEEVFEELRQVHSHEAIARAEREPKYKMLLVFSWYFDLSENLALSGSEGQKVDYQVYCGPALGAFNRWVEGTEMEYWRYRHVVSIADKLMQETAMILNQRIRNLYGN